MLKNSVYAKYKIVKFALMCSLVVGIFSVNTIAQEEWYMVFAGGQPPKRSAFFVDMNSVETPTAGVKNINFAYILEAKGSPQYTTVTVEFRCNGNEVREINSKSYTFESAEIAEDDVPWGKNNKPVLQRVKKLACNSSAFLSARAAAKDSAGKIDNNILNAEITKAGLGDEPVLLLTMEFIPDFEAIQNVVWTKFWSSQRPPRTGVAQNKKPTGGQTTSMKESAESLVKLGAEEVRIRNYDKAIGYFRQAMKADPFYAPTFFYLGYIFADVGEFEASLANYNQAIELNPKDNSSYYNRGLIYFEQKHKFDLAEADFTKAIQLDPQDAKVYFRRADLYESWGKDNLAETDRKTFRSLGGNALPGFANARRTLFPSAEFDPALAKNALQQGTSTLIGRACAYVQNGMWGLGGSERFDASNVRVALFPVTPYLDTWHELREKKEDKKTGIFINREAQKHALVTQTNGKGEFVFSRLKPGKYFLQIIFNFTQVKNKRIYTGSDTSQNGNVITTTNYYEDRDFFIDRSNRLEGFVEIKSDGESKKVTVKNKKFAIFGCKDLP